MVKIIIVLCSIFLISCSASKEKESSSTKERKSQVANIVDVKYSEAEKEEQDDIYLNSLIELKSSDIEFLALLKYMIKSYSNGAFLDNDPVLGKNEIIPSKDFTYPMPYAYSNIPKYNDIRVVLVRDKNKNIEYIAITRRGGGRFITHENLNIIKTLNLKFIKKDKLEFSNKIYTYYYTDGKFNYEIEAESLNYKEQYPSKFYSFLMKKSF